jgi:hypothetical protein
MRDQSAKTSYVIKLIIIYLNIQCICNALRIILNNRGEIWYILYENTNERIYIMFTHPNTPSPQGAAADDTDTDDFIDDDKNSAPRKKRKLNEDQNNNAEEETKLGVLNEIFAWHAYAKQDATLMVMKIEKAFEIILKNQKRGTYNDYEKNCRENYDLVITTGRGVFYVFDRDLNIRIYPESSRKKISEEKGHYILSRAIECKYNQVEQTQTSTTTTTTTHLTETQDDSEFASFFAGDVEVQEKPVIARTTLVVPRNNDLVNIFGDDGDDLQNYSNNTVEIIEDEHSFDDLLYQYSNTDSDNTNDVEYVVEMSVDELANIELKEIFAKYQSVDKFKKLISDENFSKYEAYIRKLGLVIHYDLVAKIPFCVTDKEGKKLFCDESNVYLNPVPVPQGLQPRISFKINEEARKDANSSTVTIAAVSTADVDDYDDAPMTSITTAAGMTEVPSTRNVADYYNQKPKSNFAGYSASFVATMNNNPNLNNENNDADQSHCRKPD